MKIHSLHSWDLTPREAAALQLRLAGMVRREPFRGPARTVAGADVAYSRADRLVFAAVVIMEAPGYATLETATEVRKGTFPYVPGLLSFREGPAVLEAFRKVRLRPDLVFFDGQGTAHPRRLGLASHLGLWIGVPSIGCAKSRLCGEAEEPALERGAAGHLVDRGEVVGSVLRTKKGVRPLFISPGHLIDLPSAVRETLAACTRYRLPEPARAAHHLVTALKSATLGAEVAL
jgi:deoxyribonuclease V